METKERLFYPYLSSLPYCGVCLKTGADSKLTASIFDTLFTLLQLDPVPAWLCIWCQKRVTKFMGVMERAQHAQNVLNVISNMKPFENAIDPNHVHTQINSIKFEGLTIVSRPLVNIATGCALISKLQPVEPAKLKKDSEDANSGDGDGADDEDRDWNMVLMQRMSNETASFPDICSIDIKDNVNEELNESGECSSTPKVIKDSSLKSNSDWSYRDRESILEFIKNSTIENKSILKTNQIHKICKNTKKEENREEKQNDVMTALEEMDSEAFIISEEFQHQVEVISSEEAFFEHRKNRRLKPAFLNAPYKCYPCALRYETLSEYKKHMENHSPDAGHHTCASCGLYFALNRELVMHRKYHPKQVKCKLCGCESIDKQAATIHYISRHTSITFTCWICSMDFKRPINLKKHMAISHKDEPVGCPVCCREFKNGKLLREHVRVHSAEEIGWHECPTCKKKSRNAYNMKLHIASHDTQNMLMPCKSCEKMFKNQHFLYMHVQRKHAGDNKKFQCDECGKFFHTKAELRCHVQWTHGRQGVDCPYCSKKFRTTYKLNLHVKRWHENVPNVKDKICDFCGRAFSMQKTLDVHRLIHTGERPHTCQHCGMTFRQRAAMYLHIKAKHKPRL